MSDVVLTLDNGGVQFFRLVRVAHALNVEITTGMKMSRGSTMKLAADTCGSAKRTKRGVLRDYVQFLRDAFPHWEPPKTIADTLTTPKR